MIVEMTPKYAEYERHRGERFETDGKTYKVGGEEVYYLKGYGAYAKDGLRELGIEVDGWHTPNCCAGMQTSPSRKVACTTAVSI